MSRVITLTNPSGATLKTKEKYVDDDIAVQVDGAENVVAGNIKSGVTILGVEGTLPPAPSGTLEITENGTYDVSGYENVTVEIGGGTMYLHTICEKSANTSILNFQILSSSNTPFTQTTILDFLNSNGGSDSNPYMANGVYSDRGVLYSVLGVYKYPNVSYPHGVVYIKDVNSTLTEGFPSFTTFIDTVTQIL